MFLSGLRGLLVVLFGVGVVACQTVPDTRLDSGTLHTFPHGIVMVQVLSNAHELSSLTPTWTSIRLVSVDDPSSVLELHAAEAGLARSAIFIGAVPTGDYMLTLLRAQGTDHVVRAYVEAPLPRTLGHFTVTERRLTNLGTLAYQPLASHLKYRNVPYIVTRVDQGEDLIQFLADAHPSRFRNLKHDYYRGWSSDHFDQEHEAIWEKVRDLAAGFSPFTLHRGAVQALTGFAGSIHWREDNKDGWNRVDTGVNQELVALTEFDNGYLAGGERGLVLYAQDLQGPWTRVPGPGSQFLVSWLRQMPDGRLFAVSQSGRSFHLHQVSEGFEHWEPLLTVEQPLVGWNTTSVDLSPIGRRVFAFATDESTIVLFGNHRRYVIDLASGSIQRSHHRYFPVMVSQPDGVLMALPLTSTFDTHAVVSMDWGESWHQAPRGRDSERPVRQLAAIPYRLPDGEFLSPSRRGYITDTPIGRLAFEEVPRMRSARNRHEILWWGKEMNASCLRILHEISRPEALYVACDDGRIKRSTDHGVNWSWDLDFPDADDVNLQPTGI